MYGSVVRSALLPAWVCRLSAWRHRLAPLTGLDQMSRNKRPFGPPIALKGFRAKRSFGAWLPSSPAASVLPWLPDLLHLTT